MYFMFNLIAVTVEDTSPIFTEKIVHQRIFPGFPGALTKFPGFPDQF